MLLESKEQENLFKWAKYYPAINKLMFAIPNGGSRHKLEAFNLKKQGIKAGVSDIFLAKSCGKYHGLFIEMKRKKGGKLTKEQKIFIDLMRQEGFQAEVAKGADEAIKIITEYLKCK